jgi:predicted transcriptional regulator
MAEMVGTPRMIKLLNKDVIEGIIKVNGPITKPEIARLTNLSLVTVNKTVDILVKENKVKLSSVQDSSVGRRAQYLR